MSLLKRKYMMSLGESERLPSGYQKVEYIQSTGTQYIDTGINLSTIANLQNIEVETTFQQTATPSYYAYVFGSQNSGSPSNSQYMRTSTQGELQVSGFGFVISSGLTTQKCSVKMTKSFVDTTGVCVANGTTKAQQTITPDCANENVYLLWCSNGHNSQVFKGKLFEFRFRINGTLMRDFIPCYRKSDSEVGMYDLVSGTFLTNQGSGKFLAGVSILNEEQQKLYQQVEYIQSSGGQYINTGYVPTQNTQMELDFADNDTTNDTILCGSRNDTITDTRFSMGTNEDTFLFSYGYAINKVDRPTISNGVRHYAQMKYASAIFDGVNCNIHVASINFTKPIYIGCGNWGGSALWFAKCKYYGFRLKESNVYVRDLVPCYRKSDSEAGLLDVVNNVFYVNQGSGSFIIGGGNP